MRVVLYADDMEPITVLELSNLAQRYLQEHGVVRLAVMLPPMLSVITRGTPIPKDFRDVTIRRERFIRDGREHMLLFTNDEESALLLKCAFLPGQRAELQEEQRKSFAKGFLYALSKVGR